MRTRCGRAAARGLRVRGAAAPARSSLVPRHASRRPERLRTALARRDALMQLITFLARAMRVEPPILDPASW